MLNWLKRKPRPQCDEFEAFAKNWFGPHALSVAIAKNIRAYVDAVKSGEIAYPAHRRKDASVVEIWRDLRLEALHKLFNFGKSEIFLLCDQKKQLEVLECFLNDRPNLEVPQPRGESIPDAIQAMFQVYVYLTRVGSEVFDRETATERLRLAERSIVDKLTHDAKEARSLWAIYERAIHSNIGPLPQMPNTLLEIIYEDVTAKSKSIALSAIFGPKYELVMKQMLESLTEEDGDVSDVRKSLIPLIPLDQHLVGCVIELDGDAEE